MKRILLFVCIIVHSHAASFISSATNYAKETHTIVTVKPVKQLQEQFIPLLQKNSVAWVKMKTEDELAQTLFSLALLEHFRPDNFQEHKLQKFLDECLLFINKVELPETLHFQELHTYLDFWYFSKFYELEIPFTIPQEVIKKHIYKKQLVKVNDPFNALLSWNYLTILAACDPKPYKRLQRYKKRLKKIALQNNETRGYLLTHELFYSTHFGRKKLRKKKRFTKQLTQYLTTTNCAELPLVLRAQLFTSLKLIEKGESPAAQIIASTLQNAFSETVLESCMLTVAAA